MPSNFLPLVILYLSICLTQITTISTPYAERALLAGHNLDKRVEVCRAERGGDSILDEVRLSALWTKRVEVCRAGPAR